MATLKRFIKKILYAMAVAIDPLQFTTIRKQASRFLTGSSSSLSTSTTTPQVPSNLVPGRFINAPLQHIDIDTTPAVLQKLIDQTAVTWTKLGKENAHWSVLSWPEFMKGKIDEAKFFQTGEHDLSVLEVFFERSGAHMPTAGTVLELGCGVGRLTRQIAAKFNTVLAIDISQPHLFIAAEHLKDANLKNVEYVHLTSPDKLDSLPQVELFYSIIVLQHNPPPVAYNLLSRCLDRVSSGGYAYFQVPTYSRDYSFSVADYTPDDLGRMEMHILPQTKVLSLLQSLGFEILEVQEDGAVGDITMISNTFFCRRRIMKSLS